MTSPRLAIVLNERNARNLRRPQPDVCVVALERTFVDPPRMAATARWGKQIRRLFPNAELVPYVWHLVTHAAEDKIRERTTRTLSGPPGAFGLLQDTREVEQAWSVTTQFVEALEASRVVLRTAPGTSPGPVGQRRLTSFVERHGRNGLKFVWEPLGLWETKSADQLARAIGVEVLLPAFEGRRSAPEVDETRAWLRVDSVGRSGRIDYAQIDGLVDHIERRPETMIVFSGSQALQNLAALRKSI